MYYILDKNHLSVGMQILNNLISSPAVVQGFTGVVWGMFLVRDDTKTREIEHGNHVPMNALMHIGLINTTMEFASVVWNLSNVVDIGVQVALMVAVSGLHFLGSRTDGCIKKCCLLLTDSVLPISRCANVVNWIALFYLGNFVMATAVGCVLIVELINKNEWMSVQVQKVYYYFLWNEYIRTISSIIATTGTIQIISAISLASRVCMTIENYFFPPIAQNERPHLNLANPSSGLTPALFKKILTTDSINIALEINPESLMTLLDDDNGPVPDVDYKSCLLDLFNSLEGNAEFQELILKEIKSASFSRPNAVSKEPIEQVKEALTELLDQIQNRTLTGGVTPNYARLENQLKIIADDLQRRRESDFGFVVKRLSTLAIDAGGFCQGKRAAIIRKVYSEVTTKQTKERTDLSEPQKQKFCLYKDLSDYREFLFDQMIFNAENNPLVRINYILEIFRNQHIYNSIVEMYGDSFGLPDIGAEEDVMSQQALSGSFRYLLAKFCDYAGRCARGRSIALKELLKEYFFDAEYTPDFIVGEVEKSSFDRDIWLKEWFASHPGCRMETKTEEYSYMNMATKKLTTATREYDVIVIEGEEIQIDEIPIETLQKMYNNAIAIDMGILREKGQKDALRSPRNPVSSVSSRESEDDRSSVSSGSADEGEEAV